MTARKDGWLVIEGCDTHGSGLRWFDSTHELYGYNEEARRSSAGRSHMGRVPVVSLVGFRAQNHPQQTVKDVVDDRGTDPEFFARMVDRFGPFTVDVAASARNAKCDRYYTIADDGLSKSWAGERVWCNPPYSNISEWVEKAWSSGAELVVMLLPANRTEQRWWQYSVEAARLAGTLRVEFLPGRMRFERPDVVIGPKGDRPPFGCCLLIWESAA